MTVDPRARHPTAVLVEGTSDQAAIETLANRLGRDFESEGVSVVPMGGATNVGRFLDRYGPRGLDLRLAGLCDVGEEHLFRRGLQRRCVGPAQTRSDIERLGFFVCFADLEDELIRALGTAAVEEIVERQGEHLSFLSFQQQPAQRGRPLERQLHRFMGTRGGR